MGRQVGGEEVPRGTGAVGVGGAGIRGWYTGVGEGGQALG